MRIALQSIPASMSAESTRVYADIPLYIVSRHVQAMFLDRAIVVGERGAGKTQWFTSLQDPSVRTLLSFFRPEFKADFSVDPGFGVDCTATGESEYGAFPGPGRLAGLLQRFEPVDIWRAVLLDSVRRHFVPEEFEECGWEARVGVVCENPEYVESMVGNFDRNLGLLGRGHLVVFDALDRLAQDWGRIRPLARGLLQACLEWQRYRNLHTKLFLRPDMYDDPEIWRFPDASKLRATRAELVWERMDLFGLLYEFLGQHPASAASFQDGCQALGYRWSRRDAVVSMPPALRQDGAAQQRILEALATPYMGTHKKRGSTWSWWPTHLGDTSGQATPRSILASARVAAEESHLHGDEWALHHEGIKKGVIEASRIRVDQLADDHPWVKVLTEPWKGAMVPLEEAEIRQRWSGLTPQLLVGPGDKLPPPSMDLGPEGWLKDLEKLHVVSRLPDGRYQVPDIYRLHFGLGRKGGVKAVK